MHVHDVMTFVVLSRANPSAPFLPQNASPTYMVPHLGDKRRGAFGFPSTRRPVSAHLPPVHSLGFLCIHLSPCTNHSPTLCITTGGIHTPPVGRHINWRQKKTNRF